MQLGGVPGVSWDPMPRIVQDAWIGISLPTLHLLQGDRSTDSEPGFAPVGGEQSGIRCLVQASRSVGMDTPMPPSSLGHLSFSSPSSNSSREGNRVESGRAAIPGTPCRARACRGRMIIRRFHDHWIPYVHTPQSKHIIPQSKHPRDARVIGEVVHRTESCRAPSCSRRS